MPFYIYIYWLVYSAYSRIERVKFQFHFVLICSSTDSTKSKEFSCHSENKVIDRKWGFFLLFKDEDDKKSHKLVTTHWMTGTAPFHQCHFACVRITHNTHTHGETTGRYCHRRNMSKKENKKLHSKMKQFNKYYISFCSNIYT